jgi:crossover junction endodeoxyribonuclease RuvC
VPSRLDELTERARRTLARAEAAAPAPVSTVPGMPPLPVLPAMPAPPAMPGAAAGLPTAAPPVQAVVPTAAAQVILGIDPGTATTGYAIVRARAGGDGGYGLGAFEALDYGAIETAAATPMPARLRQLYRAVRRLIATYRPTQVAVEQLFFGRNTTTAVTVGQARGVALLAAAEAGLPVFEYKPAEVKFTVAGFGKADKQQMQRMVATLLQLDAVPRPDDAADALAICLCHLRLSRARALGLR